MKKNNIKIIFENVSFRRRIKMFVLNLIGYPKIQAMGDKTNRVVFGNSSIGKRLSITFMGKNNSVEIGDFCSFNKTNSIFIQGDNNRLKIANRVICDQCVSFVLAEGTSVEIDDDCLFAKDVQIRTSDQHYIYDDKGHRLNAGKNICIGKHVWLGNGAMICKGVNVGNGSVVAARAVVTKNVPPYSIVAGCPAIVKKEDIQWSRKSKDDNEQMRLFGYV